MAYTYAELKDAIKHRLGALPAKGMTRGQMVNQALRRLGNLYSWGWLRALTTLDLVQNQGQILLPADYGRLEALSATDGLTSLAQASVEEILEIRASVAPPINQYFWAISAGAQDDPTQLPRRVLLLAPLPNGNQSAAFSLAYYRSLGTFPTSEVDTSQDGSYPPIPADMHEALFWLCRAVAAGLEDPENAANDFQLAMAAVNEQIEQEKRVATPRAGKMRGTRRSYGAPQYPRGGIHFDGEDA